MKIIYEPRSGINEDFFNGILINAGIDMKQSNIDLINIRNVGKFEVLDADYYLVCGYNSYKKLSNAVHMGFRKEPSWAFIKDLVVIRLNNGTEFLITDGSTEDTAEKLTMLLTAQVPVKHRQLENNVVLKDANSIILKARELRATYPSDYLVGIDYETTGLYDDTNHSNNDYFKITGVSLAFETEAYFFDYRFLGDRVKEVLNEIGRTIMHFSGSLYAFNSQFETNATIIEHNVYPVINDLRHCWVQDGRQEDWVSFKYIARYYLHVPSWDDDFDTMSGVFGNSYSMFDRYEDFGAWDKFQELFTNWEPGRILVPEDIGLTSDDLPEGDISLIREMAVILQQFNKEDIEEFHYLINSSIWNVSSFGIIPSRFLGHYCNLDAYYTSESVKVNKGKYTELCDAVYRDNALFGNDINTTGVLKDEKAHARLERIINQKLVHQGICLARYEYDRQIKALEKGIISPSQIKGYPKYMSIAPIGYRTGSTLNWSSTQDYVELPFEKLYLLSYSDEFFELWKWIKDWQNPFLIAKGVLDRVFDWQYSTGSILSTKDDVLPPWINNEYHYWGVVGALGKLFDKSNANTRKLMKYFQGDLSDYREELLEMSYAVGPFLDLANAIVDMCHNYMFRKVMDSDREWNEYKKEIEPALYYDYSGKEVKPKLIKPIEIPEGLPGFIYHMLECGRGLDDLYYYIKDDLYWELIDENYERGYNENRAYELFNNYQPEDPNYADFKAEIEDWIFWKMKVLSDRLPGMRSVTNGLVKVLDRVIKKTLGDIDPEIFQVTSTYKGCKSNYEDVMNIPEITESTTHEEIPAEVTYRGEKMTIEELQLELLRKQLGLTGPASYDEFMEKYFDTYMDQNKFSLLLGQYPEIMRRYMIKEDSSNLEWLDRFNKDFSQFDLSKMYVISPKDLTQRPYLNNIKLILNNEYKNLIVESLARVNDPAVTVEELFELGEKLAKGMDKYGFMGIEDDHTLQVLLYEARQADGKFRVVRQDFEEGEITDVNEVKVAFNELCNKATLLVFNVVSWSTLGKEYQDDFMLPYGSLINNISGQVREFYMDKLGIDIPDYATLVRVCEDMLTDVDKSWLVNERLSVKDWLLKHLYSVSYLGDIYGKEFVSKFVEYVDSFDMNPEHPLYAYKIMFLQRSFKKDNKFYQYVSGMLVDHDRHYEDIDPFDLAGGRWTTEPTEKSMTKMMAPWGVNNLASKRWSGPLQTLPKNSETRRVCGTLDNQFLTYYDISQAEPRTSAYISNDKNMIYYFENNIDLYIAVGELFIGRKALDWEERMYLRGLFKSILLGIIYKMGPDTLAKNTGLTVENAKRGIELLESQFPDLTKWTDDNSKYCMDHEGEIRTILGDKLYSKDTVSYRWRSQGANQPVQNFSSVILVYGFYNVIRQAMLAGYSIRPELVVHDASINICDIKLLPIIFPFYKEHFQGYLKEKVGIVFKYDLEVMANYFDNCEITNEGDLYTLKGTNRAINLMLEKFKINNMPIEILEAKDDSFKEVYRNRIEDSFYSEGDTRIDIDHSKNKVTFKFTRSIEEMLNERVTPTRVN